MSKRAAARQPDRCPNCGEDEATHRPAKRDCRYNGHANYETWVVGLWIDNEEPTYRYWREVAQETWNDAEPGKYEWQTREQQAVQALADRLKQEIDTDDTPEVTGVYADLLNAALGDVDWHEIARGMLDETDKGDE